MEHKVRAVEPEALMQDLLALLEHTEPVPLVITGSSMDPFLSHGRDTVYLVKLRKSLRRGDMVLYRRENGQYVLHRIYKVERDALQLIGDGQVRIEPGIRRDQLLAGVSAVRRKGKLLEPGSFVWWFYEKLWIRVIRLRPRLFRFLRHRQTAEKELE